MTQDTLTEDLADWSAALSIDPQARLVLNVALTGPDSRNGYRYSEAALREAVPLYDQKPVFLDHAPDRLKPRDRSTRDLVGNIINPRFEDGRIRGDIRVLDTESGRTFLALANTNLPGVGMSHVVVAQRSTDGGTVELIRDVVCVDAVINPATTQTFRESQDASSETALLEEQLQSSQRECQQLREQLAVLQSRALLAERQCEAHRLLSESQLPAAAITPLFLQQLEQAPTTEHRRELIRDRVKLCEQHRSRPPLSRERNSTTSPTSLNSDLIAAIRFRN
ncbi:MAG: hypothetical protein U0929_09270 [Planctomycetaceae bacterium]